MRNSSGEGASDGGADQDGSEPPDRPSGARAVPVAAAAGAWQQRRRYQPLLWTGRDRMLAGLFALQLLAAAIFGGVLVAGLHKANRVTEVSVGSIAGPPHSSGGPSNATPTTTSAAGAAPPTSSSQHATAAPAGTAPATTSGAASATGAAKTSAGAAKTSATGMSTAAATPAGSTAAAASTGTGKAVGLKPGAPIKIGAVVTQTGAINFAESAVGTEAYVDMVNAHGGVNGHKIQLEILDDGLDSAKGASDVQQLINSGVFAFAGFNAPETEFTLPTTLAHYGIPLIGCYGMSPEYMSAYAYPLTADYVHYGYEMAKDLAAQGVTKPGLLYVSNSPDNAADNEIVRGFQAGLATAGLTVASRNIVAESPVNPEYQNAVTTFQLHGVNGFASIIDNAGYNSLLDDMAAAGYHPKQVADPEFNEPSVLAHSNANGTFVASDLPFYNSSAPAVRQYVQTVHEYEGPSAATDWTGEVGWLDAEVLVDALTKMGNDLTRSNLLATMDSFTNLQTGFTPPLTIRAGDHDLVRCLLEGEDVNGTVEQVAGYRCDNQSP